MAFKVKRNEAGNCITFEGSSNPVYWNACLHGEVDSSNTNTVNVINDIRTAQTGITQYEFFRIPYTEFVDADGTAFDSASAAATYITSQGNVVEAEGVSYKGLWNAATNTPNITGTSPVSGEFYYVGVSGETVIDGVSSWGLHDSIIYNGTAWEKLQNTNVPVATLEASTINEYTVYVKSDVAPAAAQTGSALYPYKDIQTAVDAAAVGSSILLNGTFTVTQPITAAVGKSLYFYSAGEGATVQYGSYDQANTEIFTLSCITPVHGATFSFDGITFKNAGTFAIDTNNATNVLVKRCFFENNGWNGSGLSLQKAESGSTLGHDSAQSALSANFNTNGSEGGAIRVNTGLKVELTDNEIKNGNQGILIIDAGFAQGLAEGSVVVSRNQVFNNIGIGVELTSRTATLSSAAAGYNGVRNAVVYNNAVNYNGNNGLRVRGGKENTLSLNVIKSNWCAGIELESVSNTRIRDLDLTDNNKSNSNADGTAAQGLASILIEGTYIQPDASFITELLNVQILNTDDGSTVTRNGIEIKQEVGYITGTGAIISIDNVGFLNQDFSITNRADLSNINLSIGDCKFINSNEKNIRNTAESGSDDYYELPFSNHTTTINTIDVEVNYINQTIILKEGVNGETLNSYHIQQLVATSSSDNTIKIVEKNTNRLQVGGFLHTHVYLNGVQAAGTLQEVINQLNGAFTETEPGPSTGETTLVVDFSGTEVSPVSTTNTTQLTSGGYQATENGENNGALFAGYVNSTQAISAAGEYYTFEVTGVGPFAMGLFDFSEPTTSIYSIASAGTQDGTYSYGYQFAHVFGREPVGPWKTAGKNNSYLALDGWSGDITNQKFSTAAAGYTKWNSGGTIEFKVGLNSDKFIEVDYLNTDLNQYVPIARSTYVATGSAGYGLLIKMGDTETIITDIRKHLTDTSAASALSAEDTASINFRWIESPNGTYTYPLFESEAAANYVDSNLTEFFPSLTSYSSGSGASNYNVFPDEDPTSNQWFEPNSITASFSGSPLSQSFSAEWVSPYVTWNEIATTLDETAGPSAFSDQTISTAEGNSINLQLKPADATFSTTIVGTLPPGLTYDDATGFITGTVGYVPEALTFNVTVRRSNAYGSSDGALTFNVADVASPFTGFTQIGGNFASPNRIVLDYDALLDYDTFLSAGQKITYSYSSGATPPTIGILNSTGRTAADSLTFNAYDELGSGSNDFHGTSNWDLRYQTFSNNIGGNGRYEMTGWSDNSTIPGSNSVNIDATFELVNDSDDNYIKLYRNDVLMLSSANTYPASGVQITFSGIGDAGTSVYIPTNLSVVNQSFGSTVPPAGFDNPLLEGEMSTSTLMGIGSADTAAQFSEGLKINHRYIIPESWVEANALPYINNVDSKMYFGVPKDDADWTDVSLNIDFHSALRLYNDNGSRIQSAIQTRGTNPQESVVNVNSLTDAVYNYAIEYDGYNLSIIADTSLSDITTEYNAASGGTFDRELTYDSQFAANTLSANVTQLPLVVAVNDGGQVNLTTSGLSQVRIPWNPATTVLVAENSNGTGDFKTGNVASDYDDVPSGHSPAAFSFSDLPTFAAGSTYTFIYHPSMESGDFIELRDGSGTVYTTGVSAYDNTSNGDPTTTSGYKGLVWDVPQDVPPLNLYYYNSFTSSYDSGRGLNFSGSTYVADVSGVTEEGPSGNFSGTEILSGTNGWLSLDDDMTAGQRLVLDSAFLQDLHASMPDYSMVFVGFKSTTWSNSATPMGAFQGLAGLRFYKADSSVEPGIRILGYANNGTFSQFYTASLTNVKAFIEVTSTGNNVRCGASASSSYNATTTPYADWDANLKVQTGDQGYGLSTVEPVVYWDAINGNTEGWDYSDVDWTGLSEITIPGSTTILTDWDKALDFSGGNEHLKQVSTTTSANPLRMGGLSTTVAAPTSADYTSASTSARPWACAIVFNSDRHNSNQHIWNSGEGATTGNDNIFLRQSASGQLFFGWGREGSGYNEVYITTVNSSNWYGVYIGYNGARFNGSNATASNLSDTFDIRVMTDESGDNFNTVYSLGNLPGNWTGTGVRMDRAVTGDFTIGGRGSNRSFNGKVASYVSTTLRVNQPMPTDAEIKLMITDPKKWEDDYRVGQFVRWVNSYTFSSYTPSNINIGHGAVQIWLMGDGGSDSFSNGIRNEVYPSDQNYTKLQFNSMASNDIETVTIAGLT